ncbi:transglycosylase SLT domain-containing protein [Rhizobium sp. VS19-DR104.2]|uniref:lytic transglycosylase domain-containing protein n=1 Tax=unclassified Rhizobium TaxID=2613769 RepID=UPI001CC77A7A|nr:MULTISPECIES: transglycosylase SLT domain-containing protein [unclassified Rhizobium]MBZ5763112.1 transglycosylase SLT domain-containing protein [Rhizobium sp. VS19-DR96]MBZ5769029.1 transglycosylase SLT domain-containing protein [Rhizobium sp. VS19-DR129.2]MBZ5776607.1 transglycosylase SLT domain-containing protein [Rhizobium sp. VS19-DRK62.2]MBZ5787731.1 transglycosylase SLT domain-containing protein [Rhizobium sp. VS19-DR121]MBZ5805105.1 transglycosylase SLT domain-containing protein [Rh
MSSAKRLERVAVGCLALAAVLAGSTSHAQVPVIDNARQKIQQATLNWYQGYQADTRKLKGASGGTADSVAPGQGSGAPDDCSADGMAGGTAPAAPSQRTPSQQEVASMVEDEAIRQSVDPNFALAIAEQESRFRQSARSAVGATGVMQLMPGTAAQLGVNPYDTRDNIRGGVKYIKQLQGMFGDRYDLIAAGYNAGPYRQSLQNGQVPNIPETQDYVKKVSAYYARNKAQNGDRTPTQGAGEPETVSYGNGCGEQIKKAVDRNTQAQVERGSVWNELLGKSTEANQQYLQRLKAGLQSSSASLRGTGGGNAKDYDGSLAMAQIQCPTNIIDTGGTRCFAVPSSASAEQIQRWLFDLQEQARADGNVATFSVMQDPALGLVTVVDARPTAK